MNPIVYVFINKGLGMSVGKVAAQAVHAALMSVLENTSEFAKYNWATTPHKTVMIMEARDEAEIRNIASYLQDRNIQTRMVVDEGVNEIQPHSLTALATTVLDKDDDNIKKTMSTFKRYHDTVRFNVEVDR